MRKLNVLVGALALGLGVMVGTLGMSLVTNSSSSASFISKLRGQEKVQTVSGPVSDPSQTPATTNTNTNTMPDRISENPSSQDQQQNTTPALGQNAGNESVSNALKEQIIANYKQDIGTFFDAWKSVDIDTFRLKLAKAYAGEVFEKHARRAEEYLVQGIGLDVTQINFDRVDVESANDNTATLRVDYRYTAKDYNIAEAQSIGEGHEQNVHMRVNLMKMNSHWMITGESGISN
jgi:hypothetical protein